MINHTSTPSPLEQVPPARRPVLLDLRPGSHTLVVFFSGKHKPDRIRGYNFLGMTKDWPVSKVYVRDVFNLWYHTRYEGIGNGVGALRAYLHRLLERYRPQRCVMVGGSMGGYAATLFGALLSADKVLTFTPQTCIDPWWLHFHADRRYWRLQRYIYRSPYRDRGCYSLRTVLLRLKPDLPVILHLGRDRLDRAHARHLEGLSGVQYIHHDTPRHDLSRVLKKQGKLKHIIEESVGVF